MTSSELQGMLPLSDELRSNISSAHAFTCPTISAKESVLRASIYADIIEPFPEFLTSISHIETCSKRLTCECERHVQTKQSAYFYAFNKYHPLKSIPDFGAEINLTRQSVAQFMAARWFNTNESCWNAYGALKIADLCPSLRREQSGHRGFWCRG